ncbi:hypothetical protein LINGRAHAP2_LOCUS3331 [Linum grandiflorum]
MEIEDDAGGGGNSSDISSSDRREEEVSRISTIDESDAYQVLSLKEEPMDPDPLSDPDPQSYPMVPLPLVGTTTAVVPASTRRRRLLLLPGPGRSQP